MSATVNRLPPTLEQVTLAPLGDGIHTFSNGTEAEGWMSGNCFGCHFYDLEGVLGEHCAFEGAALLGGVTPELATQFGWTQNPAYTGPHGWHPPARCPYFADRGQPKPEPVDPRQLPLLDLDADGQPARLSCDGGAP